MALISDNFNALTVGDDLKDESSWSTWEASGSGVARADDHDDHSDLTRVIDMSTTGINWCIYQTNVASADHYVEADVFIDTADTSGNEVGVIARGNNSSMGSSVWDGYTAAFVKSATQETRVRIWRVDNDVRTQLAESVDINLEAYGDEQSMHLLRFEVDGCNADNYVQVKVLNSTNSILETFKYTTNGRKEIDLSQYTSIGSTQDVKIRMEITTFV